jgi:hypothetical protein
MKFKNILPYFLFLVLVLIALPTKVFAFCPVCTVAVAAGVGLARWLKVDDTITGLWIGALIISSILWTLNWLKTKKWNFKGDSIIIFVAYYLLIIIPLYYTDIIGHPLHRIFGIDKLIFGIGVGTIIFLLSMPLYNYVKKSNKNKSYFKLQKIATPIILLLIASLIMYFVTKGK